MAFINYSTKEINVKIVYYGPGLSGKTANLQYLYARAPANTKGRLISLATETERTLFFDFLPMNLGTLRGFQVRFHLYTVPGQVFYEASRKLILKGVDGVLFVADSDPLRLDANVEAYHGLQRNLREYRLSIPPLPTLLQYNKRDLPGALPVAQIHVALGRPQLPQFESVATVGTGVFDSLKTLAREVLQTLQSQPSAAKPAASPTQSTEAAAVRPTAPAVAAAAAGGRPAAAQRRRPAAPVAPAGQVAPQPPVGGSRAEAAPVAPAVAPRRAEAASGASSARQSETAPPMRRRFPWLRRFRD